MAEKVGNVKINSGRLQKFKKRKTAWYSTLILGFMVLVSLVSEFVANDRPLLVIYNNSWFFPVLNDYSPTDFGDFGLKPEYRKLCEPKNSENSDSSSMFCLFPLVRYNPIEIIHEVNQYPSPPTLTHPMGLDSLGRDIFARMIYGFRVSFLYALGVWFITFCVGTVIGSMMGYFGGLVDIFFYRFMEIFFAIPYLIVLITLVSVFTPNIILLVIISSIFSWGHITRYMRAEFLRIRKLDFVMSARAAGCNTRQILFRHILPNALIPIITFSPFAISANILGLSSLDFLGLGVMPPTPSWGELLHQGKIYFLTAWYLAFYPAIGLFVTLSLINFIGEGIRDAFDPKRYG